MPLYEYQCDNCGERFEAMQKFADAPLTLHEKCGGPAHRLLSVPALQFKGSGFYINDYAKSGSGSAGNGEQKKKSESGDGSSGKEASGAKTESTTTATKTTSTKSSDSPAPSSTPKPVSDKK
jgi:putative FmdB family regulatory protein